MLGYLGWAIEQHLDSIPSNLKPTFQEILDDLKARKENLEDHKFGNYFYCLLYKSTSSNNIIDRMQPIKEQCQVPIYFRTILLLFRKLIKLVGIVQALQN